jgi:hypothetical protein
VCSCCSNTSHGGGLGSVILRTFRGIGDRLSEPTTKQIFTSLSCSAWSGSDSAQTLKLQGSIQGQHVLIKSRLEGSE